MKTLGKFELLEKLGQGAMGVVYKARDPLIGRLVALKMITTSLDDDPALLERFYHEAHSAGALQHPNIVTIYELGEADHNPFIAMEYLNGQSLDKLIESHQSLPLSQKIGYVAYVCRALAYAHKQGVVHRDVKPANVMVTSDGAVKVVDFGIARIAENSKSQSGLIIGTLGYMSPQQIEGGRADARADIWAAGILFYELLAYRRPFEGDNYGALMLGIMTQDLPPLSETAPGTPPEVAEVVNWMLRKDIDERFQSMEEVLIELEPVWRNQQRSEVSDLLASSRESLKIGNVGKAYETVRRVLQIDTANPQAKKLLEEINVEIRRTRGTPPRAGSPLGDETLAGTAVEAIRPSLSSIPASTVSRTQNSTDQPGSSKSSIDQLRAATAQRRARIPAELPSPAPPQGSALNWKKQISIALLLVVAMVAVGSYFWVERRQSTPATDWRSQDAAHAANTTENPSLPASALPPAAGSAVGKVVSPESDIGRQSVPAASVRTNNSVRDAGFSDETNSRVKPPPVAQPTPTRDLGSARQAAVPPLTPRTEVLANNTTPATTAGQPSASSQLPVAQPVPPPSQPVIIVAATPPPKLAEAAPTSKVVESPSIAAPPEKPSEDSLDRQLITVLLQQLSAAFAHKSLPELEEIWPKLGPNKNTFKKVFDSAKLFSREFHTPTINFSNGGATATAIGTYSGTIRDGRSVDIPSSGNFYVRFSKKNGRWYVDDASF